MTNSSKTSRHPVGSSEAELEALERLGLGDGPLARAYRGQIAEKARGIAEPRASVAMGTGREKKETWWLHQS